MAARKGDMGTGAPLRQFGTGTLSGMGKGYDMRPTRGKSGRPNAALPEFMVKVGRNSTPAPGSVGDYNIRTTRRQTRWREMPGMTHRPGR